MAVSKIIYICLKEGRHRLHLCGFNHLHPVIVGMILSVPAEVRAIDSLLNHGGTLWLLGIQMTEQGSEPVQVCMCVCVCVCVRERERERE